MAPDDDKNNSNKTNSHEENPFITFRRFADQQVSSLFHNVFGLQDWHKDRRNDPWARPRTADDETLGHDGQQRRECPWRARRRERLETHKENDKEEGVVPEGTVVDIWAKNQEQAKNLYEKYTKEHPEDDMKASSKGSVSVWSQEWKDGESQEPKTWSKSWDWSWPPKDEADKKVDDNSPDTPRTKSWHWQWSFPHHQSEQESRNSDGETADIPVKPFNTSRTTSQQRPNEVETFEDLWNFAHRAFARFPSHYDHTVEDAFDDASDWHYSLPRPAAIAAHRLPDEDVRKLLLNSRYSPITQEGEYYAAAFEDLVRVQEKKDLMPDVHTWDQSYKGWMNRVLQYQKEGKAEDRNHSYGTDEDIERTYADFYEQEPQQPEQAEAPQTPKTEHQQQEDQGPDTELDMYEEVFKRQDRSPSQQQISSLTQTESNNKPSILSTLTTTEKTIAPDGTVTTIITLKKKFSDGREESSETVHTTNGSEEKAIPSFQSNSDNRNISGRILGEVNEAKDKEEKKGGWFWSK